MSSSDNPEGARLWNALVYIYDIRINKIVLISISQNIPNSLIIMILFYPLTINKLLIITIS